MAHFAGAAAGRTGLGLGAGLGAVAGAGFASHRRRDADLRGFSRVRLLERDLHVVAQVRAALAASAAASTPSAAAHSEQIFENVREAGGEVRAEPVPAA